MVLQAWALIIRVSYVTLLMMSCAMGLYETTFTHKLPETVIPNNQPDSGNNYGIIGNKINVYCEHVNSISDCRV